MRFLRYIYILIIGLVGYSEVQAQSPFEPARKTESGGRNYRLRCDTVLNFFTAQDAPKSTFSVLAKCAKGKMDSPTEVLFDSLLEHPTGNMFWMYPVSGIYFYGGKNLSLAQKNKTINAFTHYKADSGITENHKLMYYASLFLMSGEDRGDTMHWFNGAKSSENYKRSGYIIKAWMNKAFATGFSEYNSPHYGGYYSSPLLLLYDFSRDKEIQYHAKILLWRIFGDYILHYHFSLIAGVSSRVVNQDIFNKKNSQMAKSMGLFLGDRPVDPNYHTLFFALSSFDFPEMLDDVWKESQKQDFIEMDAEHSMTKTDGTCDNVISYFYSDSLYSLSSLIAGHDNQIQTRTWSLDWAGKGQNTTLFGLNPYMSKTAIAEYFPYNNIDTLYKNVLKQRPFYTDTNKWIGGSPYENLFQYKNVLLGIYKFPDTLKNNSLSFFISNDIDSLKVEDTILYAKTEGICFALRFSEKPIISSTDNGKRYRIRGKKPGFILEVYHACEYKSLNDFILAVKQESASFSPTDVRYTGSNGMELQLSIYGKRKAFTMPPWTVYGSPFMNISNGVMTIETSKQKVVFDWNKQQ